MAPYEYVILSLTFSFVPIHCLRTERWKYKTKLGHIEYCCRCSKDFVKENMIQECYMKNKHDHSLLPFCNCSQGFLPTCSKNVTICNQTVKCPNNIVYSKCSAPFPNNATLTCSDSLQWEASFQCPKAHGTKFAPPKEEKECPHSISVCGKTIQSNKTVVGTEFEEFLFDTRIHFKCQYSYNWEYDFQCSNDKELFLGNKQNVLRYFLPVLAVILFIIFIIIIIFIWRCKNKVNTLKQVTLDSFQSIVRKFVTCFGLCKRKDATNAANHKLPNTWDLKELKRNILNVNEQEPLFDTALISIIQNEDQPRQTLQLDGSLEEFECSGRNENAHQEEHGNEPVLQAANNMNAVSEDTREEKQPSFTFEINDPPKEFESSPEDTGNNTGVSPNDVQPVDYGSDTSEECQQLWDNFDSMKDDSISNCDKSLPTDVQRRINSTTKKISKAKSLGVLFNIYSSKIQNSPLSSSLPGNIDEQPCRLSIPIQEHGSTAISIYDINFTSGDLKA